MTRRKKRHPQPWQRKGRGWYLELDRRQIKLGDDEEAAFREYHRIMSERGTETPPKPATGEGVSASVLEIFDKFITFCRVNRAPESAVWYLGQLESFLKFLGEQRHMAAMALCPHHVSDWADSHDSSPSTRRGRIIAVQRAINWAVQQKRLPSNPLPRLEKPAATRRENHVTPERFAEILRHARTTEATDLLTLVWLTGCRPQEAFRVEARHLHGDRWIFPKEESKGKRRARAVFLLPEAQALCERLAAQHPSGPLLRNSDGSPWNSMAANSLMCRIARKIGHKFALYDFRHGTATRLLKAGVDTVTVAVLLGHANTDMLSRHYAHIHQDGEHLKAALAKGTPPG